MRLILLRVNLMIYHEGTILSIIISNINREGHECLVMTSLLVRLISHCNVSPKAASKSQFVMPIILKCILQEILKGILNKANICFNWRFVDNKRFKAILLTGFFLFDCLAVTLDNRGAILLFRSPIVLDFAGLHGATSLS
jgi:hypothetical protein